jgi:hypothetical protein
VSTWFDLVVNQSSIQLDLSVNQLSIQFGFAVNEDQIRNRFINTNEKKDQLGQHSEGFKFPIECEFCRKTLEAL